MRVVLSTPGVNWQFHLVLHDNRDSYEPGSHMSGYRLILCACLWYKNHVAQERYTLEQIARILEICVLTV